MNNKPYCPYCGYTWKGSELATLYERQGLNGFSGAWCEKCGGGISITRLFHVRHQVSKTKGRTPLKHKS